MKKKILVFTDLDGTLLDLNTYSFKESEEAVKTLKENGASVIFCSSKTLSEQSYFQSRLNLSDPIIVENGSAIIFPEKFNDFLIKQRSVLLGNSSEEIRKLLRKLRDSNDFKFRMFSEISVKELSEITGLDEESTKRAQQRDYSETIIIENPKRDINIITANLGENNFSIKHGGRFYTVS